MTKKVQKRMPPVEEAFAGIENWPPRHVHTRGVRTSLRTGIVSAKKISPSTAVRK